MNINSLSTPMMLNLTAGWTSDAGFRSAMQAAGPLGVGVLSELDQIHALLAQLESNRTDKRGALRRLIDLATEHDLVHDRKARGLNYVLRGLIELADDDMTVTELRALLDLLFPIGLRVTSLPYIEEAGSAVALEQAVKPEIRAKLASLTAGTQPLDQVFDAWMAAANQLASTVKRRAEVVAQTSRKGSGGEAFDLKTRRSQWIKTVRGLLWVLEIKPELAPVRESVTAVLVRSLATADRGSTSGGELLDGDIEDDEVVVEDAEGLLEDLDGEEMDGAGVMPVDAVTEGGMGDARVDADAEQLAPLPQPSR